MHCDSWLWSWILRRNGHQRVRKSKPDPKPEGLEEAGTTDIKGYRLNFRHETETYITLRRMEGPIISMVNETCVGAGFDLGSHCDLAVVSNAARFQVAYVKGGPYAGLGVFWSLPKVIGWSKAMELMMTGRFMSAEEAHDAGFSSYLVEPEDLEERTMELALEIEAGPSIGQKVGKMLAVRTANMGFDTAMQWSESAIPLIGLSRDSTEGAQTFREKREPEYKGF